MSNMTQELRKSYSWKMAWVEILTTIDSEVLTSQIATRWTRNATKFIPAGLHFELDEMQEAEWSDALQVFLLYDDAPSETISVICHSIIRAAKNWDCTINKGDVWLNDLLALRRARNTDDQIRNEICSQLTLAMKGLKGILPAPDIDQYAYMSRVYRRVSECTVAELYERNQIEIYRRAGLRSIGFDSFTLFYLLENERRRLQTARYKDDFIPSGIRGEIVKEYQDAIDDIFDTILALSSSSFDDNAESRKKFLELVKRVCRGTINDIATQLGLQRRLDIHWLRFCTVVSRKKYHHAKLIVNFIRGLAVASGDEGIEVTSSALDMNMSLPFKPTERIQPGAKLVQRDGTLNINLSPELEAQLSGEFA